MSGGIRRGVVLHSGPGSYTRGNFHTLKLLIVYVFLIAKIVNFHMVFSSWKSVERLPGGRLAKIGDF